jgi:putative hydrolase of the HAD superfamily
MEDACRVLRRYNTRLHPRHEEIPFSRIAGELCRCFGTEIDDDEITCATAFFRIFRQRLRCFPDAKAALVKLREQNLKIGVFTDVPYGMPRELVLEDIRQTSLAGAFDILLTSRDTGFRKPAIETLHALASALACESGEMAYVGNEKKDVEAARSFGCRSILIDRSRHGCNWGQDQTIASLAELDDSWNGRRKIASTP